MNKLLTTIAMCFVAVTAAAQNKADIIVSYDVNEFSYPSDTLSHSRMSLLANAQKAKYFNDISLWNDSLSSTPQGKKQLKEIIMAACMTKTAEGVSFDLRKGPVKKIHTYVFTDLPANQLTYYGKFGEDQDYYTEPMDEIKWEISDSSATVLGYECVMASTDYHGRHWTAWFAPEIPVPFGPWKLRGLPGLILKAETDNGSNFMVTGLQSTEREMTPIYSPETYQKTDRKKALGEYEYYQNNMESIVKAKFGGKVQFTNNHPERPKYDARKYSLEPDYKEK